MEKKENKLSELPKVGCRELERIPSPLLGRTVASVAVYRRYKGVPEMAREIVASYDAWRIELEGSNPTPLERIVVDRVIACHAVLHVAEQHINEVDGWKLDGIQKQIDRMHERYLSAVRALAQIRKLDPPQIQVNVAERQVNIHGIR